MRQFDLLIPDGIKIKALRKERGLTQFELAAICDVSERTIRRLEQIRTPQAMKAFNFNPGIDTFNKLGIALGVRPVTLLEDIPDDELAQKPSAA